MRNGICRKLNAKKEQFLDKHFDNLFLIFLAISYVVILFVSSFFSSLIFEFGVPDEKEDAWRKTAISLKEKYDNKKITIPVNGADITIDDEVVYIWQGITKPAITYDFSEAEVEPRVNNIWCILLCIPTFFTFMILTTLVIGSFLYVFVKIERYIFKKV